MYGAGLGVGLGSFGAASGSCAPRAAAVSISTTSGRRQRAHERRRGYEGEAEIKNSPLQDDTGRLRRVGQCDSAGRGTAMAWNQFLPVAEAVICT
jgi:hypothetical protein